MNMYFQKMGDGRPRRPSWADATRRHCLPTAPAVPDASATPENPKTPERFNFPDRFDAPDAVGGAASPLSSPGEPPPLLRDESPPPRPPTGARAAAARRWRHFAGGALPRYDIAPRVHIPLPGASGGAVVPRTIDELARQMETEAEAGTSSALPDLVFTQASPPRQFVVRNAQCDPRATLMEMALNAVPHDSTGLPPRLLDAKRRIDVTLGTVRPYAVRSDSPSLPLLRRGTQLPAMPPSADKCDALEVFVEAMRMQRPALGIHSFDVS